MERDRVISTLEKFFIENSAKYSLDTAVVFGSLARGVVRKDSDIDIAVVFSNYITDKYLKFELITDITYELTKILKRDVNIISISWDFDHPMLYYNAIVLGTPIFIKDPDLYLKLKLEAIHQMEDFQIFGTRWQFEVVKKLIRR